MPIEVEMRSRLSLVLVPVLSLATLLGTAPAATPAGAATRVVSAARLPVGLAVPKGLPTHLGLGLAAAPDSSELYGWLPDSGIPWDYAYQYLSGGANTTSGWRTWNTLARFPLWYAQGAHEKGYIPFFSYYQMLQSTGPCGSCPEPQKDLAHLNSEALMKTYYTDFATLMKRLGPKTWNGVKGFGGLAVVQVEPDLSGYAEQAVIQPSAHCYGHCTGGANNPSNLKAAVSDSGNGQVAGYGNTYKGFNEALLHIRDLYAPNVLLAFHVSDWATLYDVGSSTDPSLNATALGTKAGRFAAASGTVKQRTDTSAYNLVTNDVADRDAGYYEDVYGRDVWWDRLNVTFPNFHRWEAYVHAVTIAATRPAIVWQIPLGNQYFDTEDNTDGHYQDNRVEYFLANPGELVNAGVIGLLFGRGNGGSTTYTDDQGDGITNPASFCTTDGVSSGTVCDTNASSSSDDDGGYLRMAAAAYYASPTPL